jgi:hypothetical protein
MYDGVKQGNGMKYKTPPLFLIILLLFLCGCYRPTPTGVEFDKIDTSHDPVQTPYTSEEPIVIEMKKDVFNLTPLAEYKVSGMVVCKASYSDDWDGKISPVDLAIVWGKLAEPDYGRYITFWHGFRWYNYKWGERSPVDASYIITHSSNNHIIPANENIYRAIKTIKKKDKVVLEGFLVNLKGTYKGQTVTWNTSLSRNDTGYGSCELFYVSKVRIDTKVYE